jgi:hypothetical protein
MSLKDIFNWLINADLLRGAKFAYSLLILLGVLAAIIFVIYLLGAGALSLIRLGVESYGWKTLGLAALKVFFSLLFILVILSFILMLTDKYKQIKKMKSFSSSDRQRYHLLLFKIENRKSLGYDVSEEIDELEQLKEKYKINSL